ncbi:MAG: sugar transferase [Bacilli bacterium]|nr:sugar transferase [Bacilli bacterium]
MKIALTKSQKVYIFWKGVLDVIFSFLAILVLSLPLAIIAIITKLSSKGPILFKQKRLGKNKRVFTIMKFRSMKVDAPIIPTPLLTSQQITDCSTKWGLFMRRTYLDELPQLFNILAGQMSFIGPRPGAANHEDYLVEARDSFPHNAFMVKPGLSGYAQIELNGKKHTSLEKAAHDSYYVKNISLGLDIKVFFTSFKKIFFK